MAKKEPTETAESGTEYVFPNEGVTVTAANGTEAREALAHFLSAKE